GLINTAVDGARCPHRRMGRRLAEVEDWLVWGADADGDFRAQRHKIEILAEGVGTEARTLVRTVEPDFLTHQASAHTHRDAGKGCTAEQRMELRRHSYNLCSSHCIGLWWRAEVLQVNRLCTKIWGFV